jgi:hypothetical protein
MIDYEQYLVDVPRIFVYVKQKKFNDTPIELVNVLKKQYKRHYKYAANLCTQQTLSSHFEFFTKRFSLGNVRVVDGGKEIIYFNNEDDIKIYKPFNLIDFKEEKIKYTIYLRVECDPTTRKCRSFWKIVDTPVDIDFDKEWSIIMRDENND